MEQVTGPIVFDIGQNITTILLALIASIPAAIAAFYAHKANKATEVGNKLSKETHDLVNSQSEALLAVTKTSAHAEGVLEQKNKEPTDVFVVNPTDEPVPIIDT